MKALIALNAQSNPIFQKQHPTMILKYETYEDESYVFINQMIEDPRIVQRLVNSLMYLFNITAGDYLTFILDHGECTKNEDALRSWVIDKISEYTADPEDVFQFLIDHLKPVLMQEIYS